MTATGYPTGTVTFVFTDIEGSTRLWESEPDAMREALAAHDAIVRAAVESQHGAVFKTVGDAFCVAFARPEDALAGALDAQRRLADHAWPVAIGRVRVRMGIHTGSAVERDGDYFGPTVNRVARLMSIGYGEQILVSGSAATLLRDVLPQGTELRDLGTHRLKDLAQPEATYQVVAAGLRDDFPALKSLDTRPNNLPFHISSFIGRTEELHEAHAALRDHRLVTIAGPGGMGKSRLALQAAGEAIDAFQDGVWLIQLSPLKNADLIPQTVAIALRVREEAREPIDETLAKSLAGKRLLLLLDSAEHVIAGAAAFAKSLLNRCENVQVLVTSREPLHVTGEHVIRLQALDASVELFRDRAREVAPDARLGDDEFVVIEEICRRVEGIPLAIELAAARVATLPLAELHARLSKRLTVLVSRDSTKEERHRTLRSTIAWSYGLLEASESAILRSVAVFSGTFGLAAAAAVTTRPEDDVLELLDTLVSKSLVSVHAGSRTARYSLFDTVREYLVELTATDGSLPVLHDRHFEYYRGLVVGTVPYNAAPDVATWLDKIDADVSNVRSALEWGFQNRHSAAASMATGLSRYWRIRGHIAEGRAWFQRFLGNAEIRDVARAQLLRRAATFATDQDDYDEARSLSVECRALYQRLDDVGGVAEALHSLAVIEQRCGQIEEAAEHYRQAIVTFRQARNDNGEALAAINLTLLALARDDVVDAQRWIDEASAAAGRLDNEDLRGHITGVRGEVALRQGDLDTAARLLREALQIKRTLGHRYDVGDLENTLAVTLILRHDVSGARSSAREILRIALELEAISLAVYGFEAFSEIAAFEGRYDEAARCLSIAQSLRHEHSYRHRTARRIDDIAQSIHAALGERFESIVSENHSGNWRSRADALIV